MNGSANMQKSRTAMIIMFVVAVGMLIGAISIFTKAYNQSLENAEVRAKNPAPPPMTAPGDKPKEPEPPKPASLGEAFSIASAKPWFWWTLLNTVVLAGLGLFYLTRKPVATLPSEQEAEDRQWGKLGYFAMLSLLGFFTVVSLAIPYTWIHSSVLLDRHGWSWSSDNHWIPWLIVLAYVLGLGSMFGSLLAIKSEERSNAALRRWIYGYNAFLGALLFLSILGVLNAWFALYGPEPSDWTEANIYSISPATKRLVKSLEKPVRVYVILKPSSLLYEDMLSTLNNCKSQSTQLEIVDLPFSQRNVKEMDALIKKYDVLRDASGFAEGLLIVQDPNSDKPLTTFLKKEDLEDVNPGMGGSSPQRVYKGEQAFYAALRDLRQEKKKVTVYFTQDSGELSIDEARVQRNSPQSRTIVSLKQRIEKSGYIVKPLNLGQLEADGKTLKPVPEDAFLVIVADPLRMNPEKLSVLDGYMKRPKKEGVEPGKMIVLTGPHFGPDTKVLPSGLESLLMPYGVKLGLDVIYTVSRTDPTAVMVLPASMVSNMPVDSDIAQNIEGLIKHSSSEFSFREARSVSTVPANISYDTKGLLITVADTVPTQAGDRMVVWTEDRNVPNPMEYMKKLFESREILKKLESPIPPTVAVTVRDKSPNQPPPNQNPMMPPPPGKLGEPRMVIFGDANFVADSEVQTAGETGINIILTSLAWSRGKPELDSGDVIPKERKAYRLTIDNDTFSRLIWLPPVWLLLSVIMAGVGVAILRRQ